MKLNPQDIRKLAKITLETKPKELSCDDWLHMVGEYVEAKRAGAPSNERFEQVARHAAECRTCDEELQALSELLEQEEG